MGNRVSIFNPFTALPLIVVPQCAGGLVSRPEPVCASRWLCVFLCVGDDHIIVM